MADALGLALHGLAEEEQGMIDYANWLGHRGRIASRKVGKPGWLAFEIRALGDDVLIRGGVPVGTTKAGKPKWRKPYDSVCVVASELKDEMRRYEAETGKCADCEGSGKEWIGWSRRDGHKYKTCVKCNGTGTVSAPPGAPQAEERTE